MISSRIARPATPWSLAMPCCSTAGRALAVMIMLFRL